MIDLDELVRLAKAATPGPWGADDEDNRHMITVGRYPDDSFRYIADPFYIDSSGSEANQAFIIAADPSTVLAMAEELRLARAVVEWVRRMEEIQSPNSDLNEAMYAALAAYDAHVRGGAK